MTILVSLNHTWCVADYAGGVADHAGGIADHAGGIDDHAGGVDVIMLVGLM